jgi:hypothetical protein
MKSQFVIPAKAGIHTATTVDSRLRGNDTRFCIAYPSFCHSKCIIGSIVERLMHVVCGAIVFGVLTVYPSPPHPRRIQLNPRDILDNPPHAVAQRRP